MLLARRVRRLKTQSCRVCLPNFQLVLLNNRLDYDFLNSNRIEESVFYLFLGAGIVSEPNAERSCLFGPQRPQASVRSLLPTDVIVSNGVLRLPHKNLSGVLRGGQIHWIWDLLGVYQRSNFCTDLYWEQFRPHPSANRVPRVVFDRHRYTRHDLLYQRSVR